MCNPVECFSWVVVRFQELKGELQSKGVMYRVPRIENLGAIFLDEILQGVFQ